jgi:hypothetical protein
MNFGAWIKWSVLAFILVGVFAAPVLAGPFEDGESAYHKGDFSAALRLFRSLADSGHLDAQFRLGVMYAEGKGVQKDYVEAMKWYRKAADQGDTNAQSLLGIPAVRHPEGLHLPLSSLRFNLRMNGRKAVSESNHSVWTGPIVPAVLISVVLGGAIWMTYPTGHGGESLPVISAPPSPFKVRPADPGGMKVPYQGIYVLNPDAPEPSVKLMPPPELPVAFPR